jgi:integrase/recombinase XerD
MSSGQQSLLGQMDEDTISELVDTDALEKHLKNARVSIRQFAEFCDDEGITFAEVSPEHVNDWIDTFLMDDYAPRSIRTKVYDVSSMYSSLVNRDSVDENPVEDVDLMEFSGTRMDEHTEVRYLEEEEYEAMIDATSKVRNKLVLQLLWETGCRSSEAVAIKIADIDRDEKSIKIESSKKGELSGSKSRTVYYSRTFELTLREWLDRGERGKYLGAEEGEDGYLLVTRESPQMAVDRITEIVKKVAAEADVQKILYQDASGVDRHRVTAHAFRHSYAVHRVKNGMPIVYLQELLGHEDIEMTREYLEFRKEDIAEAERKYRPSV